METAVPSVTQRQRRRHTGSFICCWIFYQPPHPPTHPPVCRHAVMGCTCSGGSGKAHRTFPSWPFSPQVSPCDGVEKSASLKNVLYDGMCHCYSLHSCAQPTPTPHRRLDAERDSGGKVAWQLNGPPGPVLAVCLTQWAPLLGARSPIHSAFFRSHTTGLLNQQATPAGCKASSPQQTPDGWRLMLNMV